MNSNLKTGSNRIGITSDNRIRQQDFEKFQFIQYIINLCNNTPIDDVEFIGLLIGFGKN